MIYITGDIHADPTRLSTDNFPEQKEMTKNDYVIILGDFGLVWDWQGESKYEKHWLDWLEEKPFTTLFIDGNHENHDRLAEYPVEEWHGGKVSFIRPSIIHLKRGEVFELEGRKFLAIGGADSHDIRDGVLEPGDPTIKKWEKDMFKLFRINKRSWWEGEQITVKDLQNAIFNLDKYNGKVDYVLTHQAPAEIERALGFVPTDSSLRLQTIKNFIGYRRWLCGHMHIDKDFEWDKLSIRFEQIERIM